MLCYNDGTFQDIMHNGNEGYNKQVDVFSQTMLEVSDLLASNTIGVH